MRELSFDNVFLVYRKDNNEVHALDGLSFSVESGASVAIIGPSGLREIVPPENGV